MVSVTLSIPEDVKKQMDRFEEINWSGFVRKCILDKTQQLSWKKEMLKKVQADQPINGWAVDVVKKGRSDRFNELRKYAK